MVHLLDVNLLVGVIGAAITVATTMVAGLRLERWLARYAPVPKDVGAVCGLIIGATIVATWISP